MCNTMANIIAIRYQKGLYVYHKNTSLANTVVIFLQNRGFKKPVIGQWTPHVEEGSNDAGFDVLRNRGMTCNDSGVCTCNGV